MGPEALLQFKPSGALRLGSGLQPRSSDIFAGFVTGRRLCEPQGRHGDIFQVRGFTLLPISDCVAWEEANGRFLLLKGSTCLQEQEAERKLALLSTSGPGQLWETPVALGKHSVPLGS